MLLTLGKFMYTVYIVYMLSILYICIFRNMGFFSFFKYFSKINMFISLFKITFNYIINSTCLTLNYLFIFGRK